MRNRKLLVSVFNSQEAREAVLAGGRIIDSEDPKSALGNIKPRQISDISNAVLHYKRDDTIQLSTNIGEDQLLYDLNDNGSATLKSAYEISGKSSQAAIGVACAMGTLVHPCPIVKVGVDGMQVDLLKTVLSEVVTTLKESRENKDSQVMSVLFVQDILRWNARKKEQSVRTVLVGSREFYESDPNDPEAFDIRDYTGLMLDENQHPIFSTNQAITLADLKSAGILSQSATHTFVRLRELMPHHVYFPNSTPAMKTTQEVIKAMVDATAESGAGSIMLDTRIQSKEARICSVDTASDGLIDINPFDVNSAGLARQGILSLDDFRFFVEYCHFKQIEANIAGSVQSYQAQQLWCAIPELDQISTRGASSGLERDPFTQAPAAINTREHRVIKRHLVQGLVPPEQGGVLNIPISFKRNPVALEAVTDLRKRLSSQRRMQGLPRLESFFVDAYGKAERIE